MVVVVRSREAARKYVEGRWVKACGIAAEAKRAKLTAWKHFLGFLGLTLGGKKKREEEEGEGEGEEEEEGEESDWASVQGEEGEEEEEEEEEEG
jgi:hypothetical protein